MKRLIIIQEHYDKLHPELEPRAYIHEEMYSPNYGWRDYSFKLDGKDLSFPTRVEAEKWLKEYKYDAS